MEPKKISQYVKLCRKAGICFLKIDGLELELGPEPESESKQVSSQPNLPEAPDAPAYTDEELLLWSTQGNFPDPSDN